MVLSSAFGTHATYQFAELYRVQSLGWDMDARSRFSSFSGVFRVPAAALSSMLIRALGTIRCMSGGQAATMLQTALLGLSSRSWHHYALQPMMLLDASETARSG